MRIRGRTSTSTYTCVLALMRINSHDYNIAQRGRKNNNDLREKFDAKEHDRNIVRTEM